MHRKSHYRTNFKLALQASLTVRVRLACKTKIKYCSNIGYRSNFIRKGVLTRGGKGINLA